LAGRFPQIIDVEKRLADVEAYLTKAASLEKCWAQILAGTRSFGFHEVRMSFLRPLVRGFLFGPSKAAMAIENSSARFTVLEFLPGFRFRYGSARAQRFCRSRAARTGI
jgi:hypothetical protein